MNYYMPYFNMYPSMSIPSVASTTASASRGLFSRLFGGGFNLGNILNTTQKTLNLVNQAIPVIKQVTPVMKNAKTIFRVMNEFKKEDSSLDGEANITTVAEDNTTPITTESRKLNYDGSPTFFIN